MNIKEYVSTSGKLNNGVLENVKILGLTSKNGRTYTKEAMEKGKCLYENAPVYVNHQDKGARKVEDKFGEFKNVKVQSDGLYGDLTYLQTHDMAPRVEEAVERHINLFGMSHSIYGDSKKVDGKEVVECITQVESVDLVANPATNKGLFEAVDETKELIFEQVEVNEVVEEVKEDVIDEQEVELNNLRNEINNIKEELRLLKEVKIQEPSKVICMPNYTENKSDFPTGYEALKKFFQE